MKRSEDFIKELYEQHVTTVYKVCFMYMKNAADTEDCVQDVFIKLIEHPKEFESDEHAKAWLIRVAENVCKNVLKRSYRKDVDIESQEIPSEQEYDETFIEVMNLPEKYKSAIYLHYYEGYTCLEIAKMHRCTESTVRSQLFRGREMLKEKLSVE